MRQSGRIKRPFVSCIMPTADRGAFAPNAIRAFLMQDYPERELIVLDDGEDPVSALIPVGDSVRYFRLHKKQTIGAKRNIACAEARGEIILHWDDDDWSASWRVSYQVGALVRARADVCGIDRVLFLGPRLEQAWEYVYPADERPWVCGGALCYTRALWLNHPFPDLQVGEDCEFLWGGRPKSILRLGDNRFYVGLIHSGNTSPKRIGESRWRPRSSGDIRALMGEDWERLPLSIVKTP